MRCAMNNVVSRTLSVHKEHELLTKLEAAGMSDIEAQLVIESKGNALAVKMLDMIRRGGQVVSSAMDRAREIMGKNFLGVAEALRSFKLKQTKEVLMAFDQTLPTEAELVFCKDTHLLVADFGISLLDVRSRVKRGLFYDQNWYESYRWAKNTEAPQWRLIRKTEVPGSLSKNWSEQSVLLTVEDVVPSTRQMAYAVMLNQAENNERLFENIYVRTSDVDSGGDHVNLGYFDKDGLDIDDWYGNSRDSSIGLASARKSK